MEEQTLVKNLVEPEKKSSLKEIFLPVIVILLIILAGGATGYLLVNKQGGMIQGKKLTGNAEMIQGSKEIGIKDDKTFKDTAQGRLEMNDAALASEGSHRLIRPGGPSQTAQLTSSVVDLNQFVGKCIQVWGETNQAQKAGWLMDVGRVKVLDSCPEGI